MTDLHHHPSSFVIWANYFTTCSRPERSPQNAGGFLFSGNLYNFREIGRLVKYYSIWPDTSIPRLWFHPDLWGFMIQVDHLFQMGGSTTTDRYRKVPMVCRVWFAKEVCIIMHHVYNQINIYIYINMSSQKQPWHLRKGWFWQMYMANVISTVTRVWYGCH